MTEEINFSSLTFLCCPVFRIRLMKLQKNFRSGLQLLQSYLLGLDEMIHSKLISNLTLRGLRRCVANISDFLSLIGVVADLYNL